MKHSEDLRCYKISFLLCCFLVSANSQQRCLPPDVPADGKYTPEKKVFLPGDKVTYICNSSYILTGKNSRTCRFNGFWTEKTPFCDRSAKLKNPSVSNTLTSLSISHVIDGDSKACFTWEKSIGQEMKLHLDDQVVIHIIRIFLKAGTTTLQIFTGMDNDVKLCADYHRFIETSQWMQIKCSGSVLANKIKILNSSDKVSNITICEIQVYVKDEHGCDHSPEVIVPNGYFKISRNKANLICDDGYTSENGRLVCEGNAWKNIGSRCVEKLCDAKVSNTTLTEEAGEWKFLEPVSKISTGTKRQLKCNTGYKVTGGPERVTCQKNGMWTKTNATCNKTKEKQNQLILTASIGALVGVIVLTLLGITVCLIRKQRNREVVVVYKSTDGSTSPASEAEYASVHYESIRPNVPPTPRPTVLPPALSDSYFLPENSKGTLKKKPMPADIAFGTLKESSLYAN